MTEWEIVKRIHRGETSFQIPEIFYEIRNLDDAQLAEYAVHCLKRAEAPECNDGKKIGKLVEVLILGSEWFNLKIYKTDRPLLNEISKGLGSKIRKKLSEANRPKLFAIAKKAYGEELTWSDTFFAVLLLLRRTAVKLGMREPSATATK